MNTTERGLFIESMIFVNKITAYTNWKKDMPRDNGLPAIVSFRNHCDPKKDYENLRCVHCNERFYLNGSATHGYLDHGDNHLRLVCENDVILEDYDDNFNKRFRVVKPDFYNNHFERVQWIEDSGTHLKLNNKPLFEIKVLT